MVANGMTLFYPSFRPRWPGTSRWIGFRVAAWGRSAAGNEGEGNSVTGAQSTGEERGCSAALRLLGVGRGEELDRDGTL